MTLPYNVRDLDGMTPSIAHPDGKELARDLIAGLNAKEGVATIALGAAAVNVDVAPELHGNAIQATLMSVDTTLTSLLHAVWSGSVAGRFTITGVANATAAVTVGYRVQGKSVG